MASRKIEDLHPSFQPLVKEFLSRANRETAPYITFITDGFRSNAEQTALYAQGRTKPGKVVTNAKAGESLHNYGLAVDVAFQLNGQLHYLDELYRKIVPHARELGIEWGGDWKSFPDKPHFQYTQNLRIDQLKAGQRPEVKGETMDEGKAAIDLVRRLKDNAWEAYFVNKPGDVYWVTKLVREEDYRALGGRFEDVKTVSADSPSKLQARIDELTRELEALRSLPPKVIEVEKVIEKPVIQEIIKTVEVTKVEYRDHPLGLLLKKWLRLP